MYGCCCCGAWYGAFAVAVGEVAREEMRCVAGPVLIAATLGTDSEPEQREQQCCRSVDRTLGERRAVCGVGVRRVGLQVR